MKERIGDCPQPTLKPMGNIYTIAGGSRKLRVPADADKPLFTKQNITKLYPIENEGQGWQRGRKTIGFGKHKVLNPRRKQTRRSKEVKARQSSRTTLAANRLPCYLII